MEEEEEAWKVIMQIEYGNGLREVYSLHFHQADSNRLEYLFKLTISIGEYFCCCCWIKLAKRLYEKVGNGL